MGLEIPRIVDKAVQPEVVLKENIPHHNVDASQIKQIPERALSQEDIKKMVQTLERTASIFNKRLKIRVNKEIDRIVVKVIDKRTDKVIKEIPPVELQRLIAKIRQTIGLLVDEKI